jgi:hypothetical protein
MADRDTTSTPYKLSWDGVCYFRYPNGDLPRPEYFVTQAGAGTRDGLSLDNAWAYADIQWGNMIPGSTLWCCGTFTSLFQIQGGGDAANHLFVRGDYPGNAGIFTNHLRFRGNAASYITCIGLDISGYVRAEAIVGGFPAEAMTFNGDTVTATTPGRFSGFVPGMRVMANGLNPNGFEWGYIVLSATADTLTVDSTQGRGFAQDNSETITFQGYAWHNHITMRQCRIALTGDSSVEIFQMNIGSNIRLESCELDGNDHSCWGATYNEVKPAPGAYYNDHYIGYCHIHNIGSPTAQAYDNHGIGVQKVIGYMLECCNIEDVAGGVIFYPTAAHSSEGIYTATVRYNRIVNVDERRHDNQYQACGFVGTGDQVDPPNNDISGWRIYHNVIGPLIPPDGSTIVEYGYGVSCKGNGAAKFYNNTVYQMAAHYNFTNLDAGTAAIVSTICQLIPPTI